MLIFLMLILGGFLIFSFLTPNTSTYKGAADRFIQLLAKRDGTRSYAMLTDSYKTKIGNLQTWQSNLEASFGQSKVTPKFQDIRTVQDSTQKTKDPHWVTYTMQINGTNWRTFVLIINDNNSWKVDGMRSNAY